MSVPERIPERCPACGLGGRWYLWALLSGKRCQGCGCVHREPAKEQNDET
jgi:hypothetical protein